MQLGPEPADPWPKAGVSRILERPANAQGPRAPIAYGQAIQGASAAAKARALLVNVIDLHVVVDEHRGGSGTDHTARCRRYPQMEYLSAG
jgi:hypothetical protein